MGWRVAAAWALIGFGCQCFVACWNGLDLVAGLSRATAAYFVCGAAGLLAGFQTERLVERSFRRRFLPTHTQDSASAPTLGESTT